MDPVLSGSALRAGRRSNRRPRRFAGRDAPRSLVAGRGGIRWSALPKTLVTGATGFIGSHLARALHERGDELRLLIRRSAPPRCPGGRRVRAGHRRHHRPPRGAPGDEGRRPRLPRRRAHLAARRGPRRPSSTTNVRGARIVFESALEEGVERARPHLVGLRDRRRPAERRRSTRRRSSTSATTASPTSTPSTRPSSRRCGSPRRGLPVVIVNPSFVLGPDDPTNTSMGLVKRFLLRRIPAYVDGGLNIVDVRDVAEGHLLADEKGEIGERYILGGRNFTLDRLFADLARISGVPAPRLKVPASVAIARAGGRRARPACPLPGLARRGPLGRAVVDVPKHQGQARARLRGTAARGDAGGGGRLAALDPRRPGRHRPPRVGRRPCSALIDDRLGGEVSADGKLRSKSR